MSAMRAATTGEKAYLRTIGQMSKLYVAGLTTPPTVFAALVNQATFASYDKIATVPWDNATTGAYTDVVVGMTMWIGTSLGGRELGEVRVRSIDGTNIGFGESSDIRWEDELFLTVKDEMLLCPKHVRINANKVYMDYNVEYTNQHESMNPVPVMGSDVVLDVVSYPASVTFPESVDCWVPGSTISGVHFYSNAGTWTNPTSTSASLNVANYPTNGLIRIWMTVTAANGKTSTGYRYVHVFDSAHPPVQVPQMGSLSADYDSGGWMFDISMYGDLSAVRDRAKVILFARDYYGDTRISLGQVAGRENIVAIGYVDSEATEYNAEMSMVRLSVQGPQFWLGKMSGFPPGVEVLGVASWTRIRGLTVDRAVWHLLYWRSTAMSVMDVRLSGDTRLASAFEVPTESLWAQIVEIAQTSIFANPGCNRCGQLFLEIEPQLVPATEVDPDERTWATVMELTKADWKDSITMLCKCDVGDVAMLAASGVVVNSSGKGTPIFSLSPGHVFKHYGEVEINDRLLLSDQAQSNTLAGLITGWRNNYYPSFDIALPGNNRMLDLFPRSFCSISIDASDTVRGKAFYGNLILRSMSLAFDPDSNKFSADTNWEAETFPELSTNGDPPADDGNDDGGDDGGDDCGLTTCPAGQYLDENHCCIPDTGGGGETPGAKYVSILVAPHGYFYTLNFDATDPLDVRWFSGNFGDLLLFFSGDPVHPYYYYADDVFTTPDGHVYIVGYQHGYEFIAVASAPGQPFEIIIDADWMVANYPNGSVTNGNRQFFAFNVNANAPNFYSFIAGEWIDPNAYNLLNIYYNNLTPVVVDTSWTLQRGGATMNYGHGVWTVICSGNGFSTPFAVIFENAGVGALSTSQETSGEVPILWRLGDEENLIFRTRILNDAYSFTGTGADAALWTINPQMRNGSLVSDPTGQSIMVGGTPPALAADLYLSVDAGATWSVVTITDAFPMNLVLANAWDVNMWIASRQVIEIWWTPDAGVTWENRAGNLVVTGDLYIFPTGTIKQIRVGHNAPPQ